MGAREFPIRHPGLREVMSRRAVRGDSVDEVSAWWTGPADGATIVEALAASPWSACFGMRTDRSGVTWIIDVAPATEG